MNTQKTPAALRLADELNEFTETGADPDVIQESATELRRLHSVNAELLGALQKIIEFNQQHASDQYGDALKCETWACIKVARAAIAKATGASNG